MKGKRFSIITVLLTIGASVGWKFILLQMGVFPFNADEAVVALMARHILAGERPVFFYGQYYMGSLDAYLVSLGFLFFEQQVWVIRLMQVILYAFLLLTIYFLGKRLTDDARVGCIAVVLSAIPTVNMTLYTTVSLGGYGEALLLGNLIILTMIPILREIAEKGEGNWFRLMVWGLLVGFGVWVNGLTLVYSVPAGLVLLFTLFINRTKTAPVLKSLGLIILGGGMGAFPWIVYGFQTGLGNVFGELFGSAIVNQSTPYLNQLGLHIFSFFVFGMTAIWGLRPPWEIRWLAFPLLPFVLIFWIITIGYSIKNFRVEKNRTERLLIPGILVVFFGAFVFTPFGGDPSGRYFLPITVMMSIAAANFIARSIKKIRWQVLVVSLLLIFNLWGTLQCGLRNPPGLTTQFDAVTSVDHSHMEELIDFLDEKGETVGYTNYWVAYPLAFQSNERVIFVPSLPYHQDFRYTIRDDRYKPYDEKVMRANKAAYITTNFSALDEYLRKKFIENGITWSEKKIGDYQIFYGLSRVVRPEEINLGINR